MVNVNDLKSLQYTMKNEDFSSAFSAETRQHTIILKECSATKQFASPSLG